MANKASFGKKLNQEYFKYLKDRYHESSQRAQEILELVNALDARGFALEEHRDVIRREFLGSVQRYLFGFYEDAIYHSCFAVEFALLHLLEGSLDERAKDQIHDRMNKPKSEETIKRNYVNEVINRLTKDGIIVSERNSEAKRILFEEFRNQEVRVRTSFAFGFRQITRECKRKGLIDSRTFELANKLNDIRDTHLHPQNFISGLISQYKRFLEVPKPMQGIFFRFVPGLKVMTTMPDYGWSAKDTVKKEVEKEVDWYFSDVRSSLKRLQVPKLRELLVHDFYFRQRAQQSLKLSFQILRKIGFY